MISTFLTLFLILEIHCLPQKFTPPSLGLQMPKDDPFGLALEKEAANRLEKFQQVFKTTQNGLGIIQSRQDFVAQPLKFTLTNVNGQNYVSSVKNQGACGSCVAFATMGALESSYLVRDSQFGGLNPQPVQNTLVPDFSESALYYCDGQRQCQSGWWLSGAADTIVQKGVVMEETCSPYNLQGDGSKVCTAFNDFTKSNGISACSRSTSQGKWVAIQLTSYAQAMNHMQKYGAVVSRLNIYDSFPGYSSTAPWQFDDSYVYQGHTSTSRFLGGHAILLTGWDNVTQSWEVKNSWGDGFGNKGFFKIAYGVDAIASEMWGYIWEEDVVSNVVTSIVPTTTEIVTTTTMVATTTVAPSTTLASTTTTSTTTIKPTTTTTPLNRAPRVTLKSAQVSVSVSTTTSFPKNWIKSYSDPDVGDSIQYVILTDLNPGISGHIVLNQARNIPKSKAKAGTMSYRIPIIDLARVTYVSDKSNLIKQVQIQVEDNHGLLSTIVTQKVWNKSGRV